MNKTPDLDTSAETEEEMLERYRQMSPGEKLREVYELSHRERMIEAEQIKARYGPDIPERELILRLAALHIDRETMIAAFGWDPEVEGY